MPLKERWPPKIFQRKGSANDFVKFRLPDGRRREFTLGKHDSDRAKQKYATLLEDLQATRVAPVQASNGELTVAVLLANYEAHSKANLLGNSGRRYLRIVRVLAEARKLQGETLAKDFGPRQLRKIQAAMAHDMPCPCCQGQGFRTSKAGKTVRCRPCAGTARGGWAPIRVNWAIGLLRKVWRWAASQRLVKKDVCKRLREVRDLHPAGEFRHLTPGGQLSVQQPKGKPGRKPGVSPRIQQRNDEIKATWLADQTRPEAERRYRNSADLRRDLMERDKAKFRANPVTYRNLVREAKKEIAASAR